MPTTVAKSMPENVVTPIARRLAEPAPEATTNGHTPKMNDHAVIKTARNRKLAAVTADSYTDFPLARCSLANSTIKMAFLLAKPINMINPNWA